MRKPCYHTPFNKKPIDATRGKKLINDSNEINNIKENGIIDPKKFRELQKRGITSNAAID